MAQAKTKKNVKEVSVRAVPVKVKGAGFRFPQNLLDPIGHFLSEQIQKLEWRKKALEKEDPFSDDSRLNDNAALDSDAAEQAGHSRVSAVQRQIDRQIVQLRKALTKVKIGTYGLCENCGEVIDTDRLMVYPEATFCVNCEKKREK